MFVNIDALSCSDFQKLRLINGLNGGLVTGVNGVNPLLVGGLNPPIVSGGAAVLGQPPLTQVRTDNLPLKHFIYPTGIMSYTDDYKLFCV